MLSDYSNELSMSEFPSCRSENWRGAASDDVGENAGRDLVPRDCGVHLPVSASRDWRPPSFMPFGWPGSENQDSNSTPNVAMPCLYAINHKSPFSFRKCGSSSSSLDGRNAVSARTWKSDEAKTALAWLTYTSSAAENFSVVATCFATRRSLAVTTTAQAVRTLQHDSRQ